MRSPATATSAKRSRPCPTSRPTPLIQLHLLIPDLRLTVGTLTLAPVRALVGVYLEELLAPVLTDEPTQRTDAWGARQFCYPLLLRPGDAVLGPLAEMGIAHSAGLCGLTWAPG